MKKYPKKTKERLPLKFKFSKKSKENYKPFATHSNFKKNGVKLRKRIRSTKKKNFKHTSSFKKVLENEIKRKKW